ncbi:MAG: hypothetical protein IAF58_17330, partial [Leptolyngbya sp.]|nr:hypothetical protein [Candidatus Melainabacteria bacterium]
EKAPPGEKAAPVEKVIQAEKGSPVEKSIPLVKPAVVEALPINSRLPAQDKVVNVERHPIVEKLVEKLVDKSVAGNRNAPAEKQTVEARTHALADAKPLDKLAISSKAVETSSTSPEKIATTKAVVEKVPAQIAAQEKVASVVLNGHIANTERAGTTSDKGHQQDKTAAGIRALIDIKAEAGRPNVEQAVNQTRIQAAREVLFGDIRPLQNTVKGSSELVAALHPVDRTYVGKSPDVIQVAPKDITFTVKPVAISDSRITGIKGSADLIPALFPIEHSTAKGGKESVINLSGHAFTRRPEIITSTTTDTTAVEGKRVLSSPKLFALLTSIAEGKAEIRRSPLERNQNVLELKSTKDRYVGGEFLLASLIVAAGMARKMPEKQPLPETRDNKEIKNPDLIINKKSEFSPIIDVKEHVTKSIGQLLESQQETALGGRKGPAPELVQQFTENLDFSIHDDFGDSLDIQGEQVALESQNEEQDANSIS